MLTVLSHLRAKPDAGDAVEGLLTELVPAARGHDGCIAIRVVREIDDRDQIILIETWRAREDFESYKNSLVDSGSIPELMEKLVKEPAVRLFSEANV